jgi:cbb3-type cytochrome oxidase subunit 3
MIRNVLEHIGGVGAYGIFAICLFFSFFIGVLLWVARLKRSHVESMSALPLDDGSAQTQSETLHQP